MRRRPGSGGARRHDICRPQRRRVFVARSVRFSAARRSDRVGNRDTGMKKLIVFDLDGTLAESKSAIDADMSQLLHDLLGIVQVAVISGGDWPQFQEQVVSHL